MWCSAWTSPGHLVRAQMHWAAAIFRVMCIVVGFKRPCPTSAPASTHKGIVGLWHLNRSPALCFAVKYIAVKMWRCPIQLAFFLLFCFLKERKRGEKKHQCLSWQNHTNKHVVGVYLLFFFLFIWQPELNLAKHTCCIPARLQQKQISKWQHIIINESILEENHPRGTVVLMPQGRFIDAWHLSLNVHSILHGFTQSAVWLV